MVHMMHVCQVSMLMSIYVTIYIITMHGHCVSVRVRDYVTTFGQHGVAHASMWCVC